MKGGRSRWGLHVTGFVLRCAGNTSPSSSFTHLALRAAPTAFVSENHQSPQIFPRQGFTFIVFLVSLGMSSLKESLAAFLCSSFCHSRQPSTQHTSESCIGDPGNTLKISFCIISFFTSLPAQFNPLSRRSFKSHSPSCHWQSSRYSGNVSSRRPQLRVTYRLLLECTYEAHHWGTLYLFQIILISDRITSYYVRYSRGSQSMSCSSEWISRLLKICYRLLHLTPSLYLWLWQKTFQCPLKSVLITPGETRLKHVPISDWHPTFIFQPHATLLVQQW